MRSVFLWVFQSPAAGFRDPQCGLCLFLKMVKPHYLCLSSSEFMLVYSHSLIKKNKQVMVVQITILSLCQHFHE